MMTFARQGVEPGSQDTGYFVNALLSLANYYHIGIPGSPIKPEPRRRAAALLPGSVRLWRCPEVPVTGWAAMILEGEGGANDIQQVQEVAQPPGSSARAAVIRRPLQCLAMVVFERGAPGGSLALGPS